LQLLKGTNRFISLSMWGDYIPDRFL